MFSVQIRDTDQLFLIKFIENLNFLYLFDRHFIHEKERTLLRTISYHQTFQQPFHRQPFHQTFHQSVHQSVHQLLFPICIKSVPVPSKHIPICLKQIFFKNYIPVSVFKIFDCFSRLEREQHGCVDHTDVDFNGPNEFK